jgi:hypothetical protein
MAVSGGAVPASSARGGCFDLDLKLAVGATEAVSLPCLARLWRGRDGPGVKLFWSTVVVVPFLGPLFYAVWHDPPAPSDPIDRPPEPPLDGV